MRHAVLSMLSVGMILSPSGRALADDKARDLVARAIKAHGGKDRLAKVRTIRTNIVGKVYLSDMPGIEFSADSRTDVVMHLPGKMKSVTNFKVEGLIPLPTNTL